MQKCKWWKLDLFFRYVNFLIPKPVSLRVPSTDYSGLHLRSTNQQVVSGSRDEQYYNYYSCCPPPLFIAIVTAIQIAYFFADSTGGKDLMYDPSKRNEFWRYLTYIFVHARWETVSQIEYYLYLSSDIDKQFMNYNFRCLHCHLWK